MKITCKIPMAVLSCASLLCASCYMAPIGYAAPAVAYDANAAWSAASYDANGYPIYGYAYGRPVYGYTDAGVAIFSIAALTALCFIPNWGPASWYRGPAYAPRGHRYATPPRYSHGHSPNVRPSGHGVSPSRGGAVSPSRGGSVSPSRGGSPSPSHGGGGGVPQRH